MIYSFINAVLAQLPAPNSFSAVGWTILSVASLAVAYNQIDDFLKRRQEKPSAREVEKSAEGKYMTVQQHELSRAHLQERIEAIERSNREDRERRQVIYQKMDQLRLEFKSDMERVHARIDQLLAAVERVQGRLDEK